ncbi:oxygenase MpaB family protein [Mycobacterium sp. B14F4]|uniref:oxygenase MpaB family protein n=1 Tax=Mycobacterium sp. B14F4 TaxID=3153565 RepID=UPI00325CA3F4
MAVSEPIDHVARPINDPALPGGRRPPRSMASSDDATLGIGLLSGAANVIMELARPGVGYGVKDSRVESGRADRHPIKRARTTFTYLAVALAGTDEQKATYRRAVNRSHAEVYSRPEDPVSYNAFDKELQLWVAACLYKGFIDVYRIFVGEMDDATADRHYREGMALGTTLQVPAEMWPADRKAFDEYWQQSLDLVHIDDAVREYLWPIAAGRIGNLKAPAWLQKRTDAVNLFITTGFLPPRFREEMGLPWSAAKQRRFNQAMAALGRINSLMPRFVRQFPFNYLLKDLDWRVRTGRPLV